MNRKDRKGGKEELTAKAAKTAKVINDIETGISIYSTLATIGYDSNTDSINNLYGYSSPQLEGWPLRPRTDGGIHTSRQKINASPFAIDMLRGAKDLLSIDTGINAQLMKNRKTPQREVWVSSRCVISGRSAGGGKYTA